VSSSGSGRGENAIRGAGERELIGDTELEFVVRIIGG
jgi:hypothetical protein